MSAVSPQNLAERLRPFGLVLRGGFHPAATDGVPPLGDGRPATSLVLVGNVGRPEGDPMWRAFAAARLDHPGDHPMNDWTRAAIDPLARSLGAEALYPFDGPPHLPFQRWAMKAEPVAPSPIGLLIHPVHGLWHAYRAALAFAERLDLPARESAAAPCDACVDRPCLSTCPVGAFTRKGYDVPRCAGHLDTPDGDDCMGLGCRARRACPIGHVATWEPDQARFHMAAFRRGAGRARLTPS